MHLNIPPDLPKGRNCPGALMSLRVGYERLPEVSEFNAYPINYLIFIVILFSSNPLRKTPEPGF